MRFDIIFLESITWSILWTILVIVLVRIFPFMIEHDYPLDVQKVANIKKPTKKEKNRGTVIGTVGFIILLIVPIIFAIHGHEKSDSFTSVFIHIWIICMAWNAFDLLIVDWLFICVLGLKAFVLPGSEGYKGNKNYMFHFKGFVKGIFVMSILAIVLSLISYGLIKFVL